MTDQAPPPDPTAPPPDPTATLAEYLERAWEALRWKLDGLSEHDLRRPLTGTGTNLLGLAKHLAWVESGYLGMVFGRPFAGDSPLMDPDGEPDADMWATADESVEDVLALVDRVRAHSAATLAELALDAEGEVPWWHPDRRRVTLHQVLVHLIAEAHRHAGHADILREGLDGRVGMQPDTPFVAPPEDRAAFVARLQAVADAVL